MSLAFPKTNIVRAPMLLRSAEGQTCVRCGANDGTVVACHYTGLRQHIYGKGKNIKCHDCCTAELCMACHTYFDQPQQHKSVEVSEEFLHCVMLTNVRRMQRGVLIVAPRSEWGEAI